MGTGVDSFSTTRGKLYKQCLPVLKRMILKDCLGICWFPEVSVLDRKEIYAPSAGKPFA